MNVQIIPKKRDTFKDYKCCECSGQARRRITITTIYGYFCHEDGSNIMKMITGGQYE